MSVVFAMYFGLTAAMRALARDRVVLLRDAPPSFKLAAYIGKRTLVLSLFVAMQCGFLILVGNRILEIRGMFLIYFGLTFLTGFCGISIGLILSSLFSSREGASRIMWLVLIPQLVFGGALIKYEDMNKDDTDLIYSLKRWLMRHPESESWAGARDDTALRVPGICDIIPTRYSYEALVVAQVKLNPLVSRQDRLLREIDDIVKTGAGTTTQNQRLDDLKDTLALLSDMEGRNVRDIEKRLKLVDEIIDGKALDNSAMRGGAAVSAERLFTNQKVTELVSKAETAQNDMRRIYEHGDPQPINPFFSPLKGFGPFTYYRFSTKPPHWVKSSFVLTVSVYTYATVILLASSLAMLAGLYGILKWQLRATAPIAGREAGTAK